VLFRDDNGGNPCKDAIKEMKGDLRETEKETIWEFEIWGNVVSQPYFPLSSQILY
jgi:hypothetical protein